jgi:hypothetical protein
MLKALIREANQNVLKKTDSMISLEQAEHTWHEGLLDIGLVEHPTFEEIHKAMKKESQRDLIEVALLYCRTSSHSTASLKSASFMRQASCVSNGRAAGMVTIATVYNSKGESGGYSLQHSAKEAGRLLCEVVANPIRVVALIKQVFGVNAKLATVVVPTLDRFSRNVEFGLADMRMFSELGWRLAVASDPNLIVYDDKGIVTINSKFMVVQKLLMAEYEKANIVSRTNHAISLRSNRNLLTPNGDSRSRGPSLCHAWEFHATFTQRLLAPKPSMIELTAEIDTWLENKPEVTEYIESKSVSSLRLKKIRLKLLSYWKFCGSPEDTEKWIDESITPDLRARSRQLMNKRLVNDATDARDSAMHE